MKALVLSLALMFSGLTQAKTFIEFCKGELGEGISIDQAETVAMIKLALLPKAPWPVKIPTPTVYGANGEVVREAGTLSFGGYAVPTTTKFNYKFNSISEVRAFLKSVFIDKSKCDRMNEKFESMEALQLMSGTFALKNGAFKRYQLKDLTPLKGAKNLKFLIINQNNFNDVSVLGSLKTLQYIKMTKNKINSIEFVKSLPNLVSLDASSNSLGDISPIAKSTQLEELWLSTQRPSSKAVNDPSPWRKKLENIQALEGLKNLYLLVMGNNSIVDLGALKDLKKLNILSVKNNLVKDISSLKNLKSLRNLYLSGNYITDASVLLGFDNLTNLSITNNEIKDCSVFAQLPPMKKLEYHKNPCL